VAQRQAVAREVTMRLTLDYPPVWLLAFLALARVQSQVLPLGGPGLAYWPGTVLALAGVALMAAAAVQFLRARTTIVPHETPRALITTGVYRLSRNPIYLADAMLLAGLCLRWGAWPSLFLVPVFVAVITRRFILPEEARLRTAFGPEFEAWAGRVRRWL
jgi:protein-S-isoprenylcysteine O-methyltransferase Ste14